MNRWSLYLVLSAALVGCGKSASNTDALTKAEDSSSAASTATISSPVEEMPASAPDLASQSASGTVQTASALSAVEPAMKPAEAEPQLTYDEALARADQLLQDRQGKSAVSVLAQAIRQEPRRVEAYLKRALIYSEAKLLGEAINDLNTVIELEPKIPRHLNVRGYFYMVSQNYDQAVQDFSDAIGLDLSYPQPYNNRGLCRIAQKSYQEAILDFDNAIRARADYADALNNRGFAQMQIGQHQAALESLNAALEINPQYSNALVNRGQCQLLLENYDAAVADYTTLLQLHPDHIDYLVKRSDAWGLAGNVENSRTDRRYASWLRDVESVNLRLLRNSQDADSWAELAKLLVDQKRIDDADKAIQNALTLVPDHPGALTALALKSFQAGDFDQTIAHCTKALLNDQHVSIYTLRASAYFEAKKFDEAIADYAAARSFDTKVVEAYKSRGGVRRAAGQSELALADEQYAEDMLRQMKAPVVRSNDRAPEMVVEQVNHEKPSTQSDSQAESADEVVKPLEAVDPVPVKPVGETTTAEATSAPTDATETTTATATTTVARPESEQTASVPAASVAQ